MPILNLISILSLVPLQLVPSPSSISAPNVVEAIAIAKLVAKDEGYTLLPNGPYLFTQQLDEKEQSTMRDYTTVVFRWHNEVINAFSIRHDTAQTIDVPKCILYEYQDLKSYQNDKVEEEAIPFLSIHELSREVGCRKLRIVDHRRVRPIQQVDKIK